MKHANESSTSKQAGKQVTLKSIRRKANQTNEIVCVIWCGRQANEIFNEIQEKQQTSSSWNHQDKRRKES